MSAVKDEFLKHIWNLPFVDGYLYGSFFFSKYSGENVIRYGAFYEDQYTPHFFLVIENFQKLPDLSKNKSKKINGKTVYFGYVPDFSIVKSWLKQQFNLVSFGTASWKNENNLITIISLGGEIKVREYAEKVLSSERTVSKHDLSSLFGKYKYLPDSTKDWKLVTMFFGFSAIMDEFSKPHQTRHIQGNYRKGKDFLNIELRFGCTHQVSVSGLQLSNLTNKEEIKIGEEKVIKSFIRNELFMNYVNKLKRYSIICHDNEQNATKDEKAMKLLMRKAMDNMKSFYFESIPQELFSTV